MEKKKDEYLPRYDNPLDYMKDKKLKTDEEVPLKKDIDKIREEMER